VLSRLGERHALGALGGGKYLDLGKQYHIIRLLKNSRQEQDLFLYLVLDRGKSNLAMARHSLKRIEAELEL
jgi:uncharacterized protein (UPF0128 family)